MPLDAPQMANPALNPQATETILIQATLFDCDGTLVDSEVLGNEVLVQLAAEHGVPIGLAEAVQQFRGGKMAETVEALEAKRGSALPSSFVPQLRQRMAAAFTQRLRPVPGAARLVRSLRAPVGVASSGPQEKIRLSLRLTGLSELFGEHIYSAYDIGSWKPEPDIFLHAAQGLGVPARACAVVEDSLPGVLAGLAAGMRVFAYQPHGRDPAIPSEVRVVTHLSELAPLLP